MNDYEKDLVSALRAVAHIARRDPKMVDALGFQNWRAIEALVERAPLPHCGVCGEVGETEDCCGTDDFPEPGDIEETGR